MTWLTPLYGIIAASIAVPSLVILYFLKLRRRDMEVSTTLLWKKAIQDLQANAPFQKLRRNILLLLQLLALGAALFAVAQPQMKGGTFKGNRHIILIDRSASMNSLDGNLLKSEPVMRLEEAKRQAKEFVDALREPGILKTGTSDEAMVIAFDTTAEVRHNFSSDKAALKAAIDAVTPSDAPTLLGEAMRLAKAHQPRRQLRDETTQQVYELEGLEGGVPATIHLYSDGRVADAEAAKPGADDDFVFHRVGAATSGNVGIVALRAERAYDDPNKLSIFVVAQSSFGEPRTVDAELSIDGSVVRISSIKLPAAKLVNEREETPSADPAVGTGEQASAPLPRRVPASNGVVFEVEKPEAALVQIRLRNLDAGAGGADVLATDDRAWLIVPPAKRLSVAVVTAGNLFITSALKGLPLARLEQFTPDEYEKLLADGRAGTFDVYVLDGYLPRAAKSSMPPGRYLVINAIPPGAGITDKGKGPATIIVDWARAHPLMRAVNLDGLVIAESRMVELARPAEPGEQPPTNPDTKVDPGAKKPGTLAASAPAGSATAIASTDQGPAVLEASGPAWRAIVVPFDPAQSNWPFDVSYVVFMATAVDYIGGGQTASTGADRLVQPGAVISDRLPVGTLSAQIRSPDGQVEPLVVAPDGRTVFGPIRKVGVYEISYRNDPAPGDFGTAEKALRPIAADLLDAAESDIASAQELTLASRIVKASAESSEKFGRRLWPYLLLAVLGVVMLEWFVYNRKVHV